VAAAFLASAVEMVEALTIVLAVGVTRGFRTALTGTVTAFCGLALIVAVFGPALRFIPISALRLVVGALLLVFGLQWLRKAILRGSGYKALHDEDEIFKREVADVEAHERDMRPGVDVALLAVLAFVLLMSWTLTGMLRQRHSRLKVSA